MSDEEDFCEESSEGGDFSDNSEDDWQPDGDSGEDSDVESPLKSSPSPVKK